MADVKNRLDQLEKCIIGQDDQPEQKTDEQIEQWKRSLKLLDEALLQMFEEGLL